MADVGDVVTLQQRVVLQLGEDISDVDEYATLLDFYLDQGYALIMNKRKSGEITGFERYPRPPYPPDFVDPLPEWAYQGVVDYATYRILLTGNSAKQNRAQAFYASFAEILSKLMTEADEAALDDAEEKTGVRAIRFKNLYT